MTDDEIKDQTGNAGDGKEAGEETKSESKERTFTQAEVEKMIQERLNREKRAAEKQKEIDSLEGEAKLKAQFDSQMEQMRSERDEAQKALRIAKAGVELSKLGFSPDFAPMMIGEDDEATKKNIDNLAEMVNKQVQEIVASKMKKGAPPVPEGAPSEGQALRDKMRAAAGLAPKK